jgi:hypothetical protein
MSMNLFRHAIIKDVFWVISGTPLSVDIFPRLRGDNLKLAILPTINFFPFTRGSPDRGKGILQKEFIFININGFIAMPQWVGLPPIKIRRSFFL